MSFWTSFADFVLGPVETKSSPIPQHSPEAIEVALREASGDGDLHFRVSAVAACARVIAEGLALPPCYLHRETERGKTLAKDHSLYRLLHDSPNERQTSYEFREQLGYHLALNSNAFVWVNRSSATGQVLELLPCDPGSVTISVDQSQIGGRVDYFLYGQAMPVGSIWHLKGPSWLSWQGQSTVREARSAIGLARATETYGANLFKNGARPGGLLSPTAPLTPEQSANLKAMWTAQATGVGNAHRTILLPAGITYEPMGSTANDAQWIEARRLQIEEICRFFRVSPTKVFQSLGSQSYASVEQAHIAHDQDTDAHWQARFMQSANKALLTDREKASGLTISIDNRDFLRGTAKERMEYYQLGIASGIITRNEAREMEGFDRSDDASADTLTPAANLFGNIGPEASAE
ncbi:phage portal protein [Novosphingobium sp. 9U]|uniref:phage portal protein n=1 Tax=Novosphingobium sp. 9U TaxID=2653158 RepID=UPI0012F1F2B6|nr:phage portal protein [Novosphingobium sp. 9U]VWX51769.1 conserved hypothetical protein [Novosphingobium sp. 9U]